jgi:hypothetical protein
VWAYLLTSKLPMPNKTISFEQITTCNTPEFDQLYKIYANVFPLEDEREPPEAFEQILKFNQDKELQRLYGNYHEVVAAIRLNGSETIGGVVFGCTTSQAHIDAGIPSSVQAIYAFVDAPFRKDRKNSKAHKVRKDGVVTMPDIVNFCQKTALELYGKPKGITKNPFIIFEVNSPLRMTQEQIAEDTLYSGINPAHRYMFWQRAISSMPLNFSYVQPRLRDDSQPIHYLDLFCTKELPEGIPAKVLLNHLKAFCSISVLKAKDASLDARSALGLCLCP